MLSNLLTIKQILNLCEKMPGSSWKICILLIGKPGKSPGYYFNSYSPELNLYTCNRMQALLKFLRAFSDSKKFTFACCLVEFIFELPYMHLKYALLIHIARMPCLSRIFPALKSGIE